MKESKKRTPTRNKNILLGVTSSVACYKALTLASLFVKKGLTVKTVMTPNAALLLSPVLFNAVTADEVLADGLSRQKPFETGHIALSEWADLFIIAPATANTISKIASGICDNLLTTLVVSRRAPLYLAPAMESAMWNNSVIKENCEKLKKIGVKFIGPARGRLASGKVGIGRMTEPVDIVKELKL
ncbi:MAG: hypothetical protein COT16_00435 [Elusimicrobia bacterium CG08_land_8_20_14_0_20_44_26]|nr:MAG: hypothetical protein COT16_00435 [Elusimicrobia bacterium CG08_land_8_20_14_0_20_44_26]